MKKENRSWIEILEYFVFYSANSVLDFWHCLGSKSAMTRMPTEVILENSKIKGKI